PPDRPCKMWHQRRTGIEEIVFDITDQYTIEGDLFAQAILNDTAVPTPIEDAVANMRVIDAIVSSGERGTWVEP
ncbi:MAG TPA: Gfo/Idh/MocA family oxidoreductase, partial [Roseiflexaceae bacterium]